MSFEIKPAVREKTHVLVSLAGPSGCGKTYSGLLLARGLVGPSGKIGFIDTEAKRARHYADLTPFDVIDMTPPFSPLRYLNAVKTFADAGYKALVIDSMSHEWEGTGGCIEMAEGGKGLLAWQRPKSEHKKLMNYLLQVPMHVVFCCRAREKMVQVRNPQTGKDEIINQGWHAIAEKNFIFEMTASMLLDEKTKIPTLTKCPEALLSAFPEGQRITPECGAKLRSWSEEGVAIDEALQALIADGQEAAELGVAALRRWFQGLTKPDQAKVKPILDERLKASAEEVDRIASAKAEQGFDDNSGMTLVPSHTTEKTHTEQTPSGAGGYEPGAFDDDEAAIERAVACTRDALATLSDFKTTNAVNNWFNGTFMAIAENSGMSEAQIEIVNAKRNQKLAELKRLGK